MILMRAKDSRATINGRHCHCCRRRRRWPNPRSKSNTSLPAPYPLFPAITARRNRRCPLRIRMSRGVSILPRPSLSLSSCYRLSCLLPRSLSCLLGEFPSSQHSSRPPLRLPMVVSGRRCQLKLQLDSLRRRFLSTEFLDRFLLYSASADPRSLSHFTRHTSSMQNIRAGGTVLTAARHHSFQFTSFHFENVFIYSLST